MSNFDEIRQARLTKLELLKEKGIDPYPADSHATHTVAELSDAFTLLAEQTASVTLVGRVMSFRSQGGLIFFDLFDGTGKFQSLLKKDTAEAAFDLFYEAADIGDFVEVTGTLFVTKRGQQTIEVASWRMLAKSMRPLPEKWAGLQDTEERFRRRYLDALMSEEVRTRFYTRSRIISAIRKVLDGAGYLEVETPALQPLYGGASAEPFTTHHNALDIDLYLRISDELYLKRMLVAGFPKIYEIARDFRNEGIDMTHNPEFTMVEWYEAFSDHTKQMKFVERILKEIVQTIYQSSTFVAYDHEINMSSDFKVVTYFDLLKEHAGIADPAAASVEELGSKAKEFGIEVTRADSKAKLLDNLYKKTARPKLIQPTFIIDYPAEYLPLAKKNPKNPYFVEAFQLVIAGVELVKAFTELNDPLDQRARFEEQEKNKKEGEKDAQSMDVDFLEAMEYGMPPAGGVGIGIDRLVMVLTNTSNIKEVIFFPTMRPRE
jgi:lysyl-tRNA synthetase class 2